MGTGLPAMQAAPDKALSLASQLPPRPRQPVSSVSAWLRKQLVGAGLPAMQAAPVRVLSLASQLPPRPRQPVSSVSAWLRKQLVGLARHAGGACQGPIAGKPAPTQVSAICQCRPGCASSLWERACPRCRRRLSGPYRWQASSKGLRRPVEPARPLELCAPCRGFGLTSIEPRPRHSSRRRSSGIGRSFFNGSGALPRPARY